QEPDLCPTDELNLKIGCRKILSVLEHCIRRPPHRAVQERRDGSAVYDAHLACSERLCRTPMDLKGTFPPLHAVPPKYLREATLLKFAAHELRNRLLGCHGALLSAPPAVPSLAPRPKVASSWFPSHDYNFDYSRPVAAEILSCNSLKELVPPG